MAKNNGWKGKKHSAATKAKISASLKARSAGKKPVHGYLTTVRNSKGLVTQSSGHLTFRSAQAAAAKATQIPGNQKARVTRKISHKVVAVSEASLKKRGFSRQPGGNWNTAKMRAAAAARSTTIAR